MLPVTNLFENKIYFSHLLAAVRLSSLILDILHVQIYSNMLRRLCSSDVLRVKAYLPLKSAYNILAFD